MNHNFFLLMEDVSSYRMGSQVEGATVEECELCIDFLINLHASFWNQLNGISWLPNMSGSDNAKNMALGCEAGWPQLQEIFGNFVPDNIEAEREALPGGCSTSTNTARPAPYNPDPWRLPHGQYAVRPGT